MKIPRFRIAWAMGFIALAALDFRAILEMYSKSPSSLVAKGAMPMANVLVVSLLIGLRRPRSRRFLSGFVVAGAMALAVYVTVASLFYDVLAYGPYLTPVWLLFFGPKGITKSFQPPLGVYYLALAVWLTLPQLAFALIGGLSVVPSCRSSRRGRIRWAQPPSL